MDERVSLAVGENLAASVEYVFPGSLEQALELLQQWEGKARLIAGGTDVLPDLEKGKIQPRCLVDISRIPGMNEIRVGAEMVEVGAAVTFAMLKEHPYLQQHVHALVEAARSVGAQGIQNAATWAGNLVQAMPAADGAIVALALGAETHIAEASNQWSATGDPSGQSTIPTGWQPVEALFLGPGKSAVDSTRQMLTQIRFPISSGLRGTAWRRVGRRPSLTLPILNCAVSLTLTADGEEIEQARIALGPVAPRPFRARQAEQFLEGRPPSAENLAQAARLAQAESEPRGSPMRASRGYRLAIIPNMVEEALKIAIERAGVNPR